MTVDNLTIPQGPTTVELETRRVKAMEDQARATERYATAVEKNSVTLGGITDAGGPKSERFERVLRSCIEGRVATDVEGFLKFAEELCDGIDRKFPATTAQ